MNLRDDNVAKDGFIWLKLSRAKKLICTTAMVYTPIILPEMTPTMNNTPASAAIPVDNSDTMPDNL